MRLVVITRPRHPLHGQALREVGRMRRHGLLELLLVLPDGSKSLIPAAWTDLGEDTATGGANELATLGSVGDLLAARVLVANLAQGQVVQQGQAARTSPCKEDSDAACPAQFAPRPQPQATHDLGRAATADGVGHGDHAAGRGDRQSQRCGQQRGDRR